MCLSPEKSMCDACWYSKIQFAWRTYAILSQNQAKKSSLSWSLLWSTGFTFLTSANQLFRKTSYRQHCWLLSICELNIPATLVEIVSQIPRCTKAIARITTLKVQTYFSRSCPIRYHWLLTSSKERNRRLLAKRRESLSLCYISRRSLAHSRVQQVEAARNRTLARCSVWISQYTVRTGRSS